MARIYIVDDDGGREEGLKIDDSERGCGLMILL